MPDHKPPPPATLVDTLPDLPESPSVNPRAVTAAKYPAPDTRPALIVAAALIDPDINEQMSDERRRALAKVLRAMQRRLSDRLAIERAMNGD